MEHSSPLRLAALAALTLAACSAEPPPAVPAQPDSPPAAAAPALAAAPPPASAKDDKAADVTARAAATPPPPPPPGKATATDAPILGKITQDDILAAVNKNGEAFNRCYAIGAAGTKTYSAKVTVKASVGPTGVINAVDVVSSTSKNPKVDACVTAAFKTITFNRAAGSSATVFTFPLSFDGGQAP